MQSGAGAPGKSEQQSCVSGRTHYCFNILFCITKRRMHSNVQMYYMYENCARMIFKKQEQLYLKIDYKGQERWLSSTEYTFLFQTGVLSQAHTSLGLFTISRGSYTPIRVTGLKSPYSCRNWSCGSLMPSVGGCQSCELKMGEQVQAHPHRSKGEEGRIGDLWKRISFEILTNKRVNKKVTIHILST